MRRQTVRKINFPVRVEPELVSRLKSHSVATNLSLNDIISRALDALEREQKNSASLGGRIDCLGENLLVMVELMKKFDQKLDHQFNQASFNEKERLKSLLKLLGEQIQHHDEAERARFERINPGAL
jgi:hypothetical protein